MTQEIKQRIEQIKKGKVPAGYKKSKLGIVSSEWENTSFSTLFTTTSDFTEDNAKYPLYSLTIENGITAKTERYERSFLVKKNNSYKIMQPNDFAYNPMNIRFGAVARHKGTKAVSVSGYYDIFTTVNQSDLQFMDDFLSSDLMLTYYNKQSTGSLIEKKRVHFSQFLDFNLPLPPLSERKKIAEILSTQDKVIELQQKRIDELKKLKKAYLSKMFPQKGSNVPELRFKGFTGNWEQRRFSETFDFLQNNTLSRAELNMQNGKVKNVHYGDVLIKFGEFTDVQNTELSFISDDNIADKYSSAKLNNGDIVIADTAEDETVGKCTEIGNIGTIPVVSGLHTMPCRPKEDFAEAYLGFFMNSTSYHDQLFPFMQGIKVSSISKSSIQETVIKYPKDKAEQQKIGSFFRNLDHLITLQSRKLDAEKLKKKSLMQLLLTGIVRVK